MRELRNQLLNCKN